jgi:hypothetical protein
MELAEMLLYKNSRKSSANRHPSFAWFAMIQFSAHFDGQNICPDEPISLPTNVPLRISVDEASMPSFDANGPLDLFDRLEAETGLIDGPADWAAEHDHYLNGAPKKSDGQTE